MFNLYHDIFGQRGASYHAAMSRFPLARREEFARILEDAALFPGQRLCDMPAGGGYLPGFLSVPGIEVVAVESTPAFYDACRQAPVQEAVLAPLSQTGLPWASFDAVVSLAGLHHVDALLPIFEEASRILKPGGVFCVADVVAGGAVGAFLNTFVDLHSSLGHRGDFVDHGWLDALETAGFQLERYEEAPLHWHFGDAPEMAEFCQMLFGIDRATLDEVLAGIREYLGYGLSAAGCRMRWGLAYIRARKRFEV